MRAPCVAGYLSLRGNQIMDVKAILFGAIGTLTETSDLQRQAFNAAFVEHGLDWQWDADSYTAMVAGETASVGGATRIARYADLRKTPLPAAQADEIHATKSRLFQEKMTRDGVPLNPGVAALLDAARHRGLKTGFVSTTSRDNIDTMIAAARPSLAGQFDLVLSGQDVARPKPAADIYLFALTQLGLSAGEVVAIEDSEPSLQAALAAGIATFAVPGKLWRGAAFVGASAIYETLEGVTLYELAAQIGHIVVDPVHV
jgi:HAD superfamily hydrolase (TIGR01509 family)